jgi:hypothetical protein
VRFWEASTSFFVEDSLGLSWILGGLFFFVGGVFALGSLGLATNAAELSFGVRTVIFVLGAIGVGTGVWVWQRSPLSRVQVNVSDRYILINRWGITGRERTSVNFADVLAVELETGTDSEGDPVYRPILRLRNQAPVLLSLLHVHDRAQVERVIREIAIRIDR